MPEIQKPKKVKFVYYKPEDYKIYPANGAYGGATARNDIIIHFFVERHEIPNEELHSLREDGSLGPVERKQDEEIKIARDLQIGVLINYEQAVIFEKWLKEQINELKKEQETVPKKASGELKDESK